MLLQGHSFPWKNHLSPWERANSFIADQNSSQTGTLLSTGFSGSLFLEKALPALEIQFSANSKNHVLILPPGIPSYFCTTEATVRNSWRIWKVALSHFVSQLTSAAILELHCFFPPSPEPSCRSMWDFTWISSVTRWILLAFSWMPRINPLAFCLSTQAGVLPAPALPFDSEFLRWTFASLQGSP